jgi:hypothetical protein
VQYSVVESKNMIWIHKMNAHTTLHDTTYLSISNTAHPEGLDNCAEGATVCVCVFVEVSYVVGVCSG